MLHRWLWVGASGATHGLILIFFDQKQNFRFGQKRTLVAPPNVCFGSKADTPLNACNGWKRTSNQFVPGLALPI